MSKKFLLRDDGFVLGDSAGRILISGTSESTVTEFKGVSEPVLRVANQGGDAVDLLHPGSGWELCDPYWSPQIAQYKGGGAFVNSALSDGRRLTHRRYDNVVETIPLQVRGHNQIAAINTIRELLQLTRQAGDYWTEIYEFDDVWLEARPKAAGAQIGYARIIQMRIPQLSNPYGQPFFSAFNEAIMTDLTLIVEREPFWRGVKPGDIIGPLYNLIKNPDFELWNFGIADSQPDNWTDLETTHIEGSNNRQDSVVHSGQYCLRVRVGNSTLSGAAKGVTQVISGVRNNTEYTVLAWVRSDGVTNGVGRILVTYSDQFELYREDDRHGWQLYGTKFTTGVDDTVAINCEILATATGTDGVVYFDGLMLVEGDFYDEATFAVLPWLSSSHIVNHLNLPEKPANEGAINYVDVWNVPGDVDALIRLEIENNQTPANGANPVEIYRTVRVGMRRTNDIFNFQNYYDFAGIEDTTASGNDRIDSEALTPDWLDVVTDQVIGEANVRDNLGRFRVFVRVYDPAADTPTLQARLAYFIGIANVNQKLLEAVAAQIRGNWTLLNLTPNTVMNLDRKEAIPGQVGHTLQLKRDTGSDTARVDYILIMPTDGGYLEATIDPALVFESRLIIDGTLSALTVDAAFGRVGWQQVYQDGSSNTVSELGHYKGNAYAATVDGGGECRILRSVGSNVWGEVVTLTLDAATPTIRKFVEYDGVFYFIATSGELFSSTNGTAWTLETTTTFGHNDALVFNGLLFIASGGSAAGQAEIHTWDGSTLTKIFDGGDFAQNTIDVDGLVVYKHKLYAIARDVGQYYVYVYNPDTNAFTFHSDISGMSGFIGSKSRPVAFNGKLYVNGTDSGDGVVVSWNGDDNNIVWETSLDVSDLTRSWYLKVHNGKLYSGGDTSGGDNARVYVTEDGITWTAAYDNAGQQVRGMMSFNGLLFVSTNNTDGGQILVFTEVQTGYKVSDFQGNLKSSPPKKRHRFVFSYDRKDNINDIDDQALIGIGFIPRYLALRGKG